MKDKILNVLSRFRKRIAGTGNDQLSDVLQNLMDEKRDLIKNYEENRKELQGKVDCLEQELVVVRSSAALSDSKADMHYAEVKRLKKLNDQYREVLEEFAQYFKSGNDVPVSRAAIDANSKVVQKLNEVLEDVDTNVHG